jgi:hypothetical protein
MVDPVGATLAVCGAGQALDLQLHSGAAHRIRPSRSRRFSSAAGCEGSLSHRQSSHVPVLVEDGQPNPTEDSRSSPPQETQSTYWSESEPKSIGSVGVSLVRPGPVYHSSTGVSSLVKAHSSLFPEQFHPGLASRFCDILQQGTSKPSQFA